MAPRINCQPRLRANSRQEKGKETPGARSPAGRDTPGNFWRLAASLKLGFQLECGFVVGEGQLRDAQIAFDYPQFVRRSGAVM
jgi:hypothetical protein